jgi:hypothetical protein
MSITVNLQIPIDKELRDSMVIISKNNGFSSLQEFIRFLLKQFQQRKIQTKFIFDEYNISKSAEKRLLKKSELARKAEEDGTIYVAESADELIRQMYMKNDEIPTLRDKFPEKYGKKNKMESKTSKKTK